MVLSVYCGLSDKAPAVAMLTLSLIGQLFCELLARPFLSLFANASIENRIEYRASIIFDSADKFHTNPFA